MQRDLAVCRDIILAAEACAEPFNVPLEDLDHPAQAIAFNAEKLAEAGFIKGESLGEGDQWCFVVHRLTDRGCDLAELLRQDGAFDNALEVLGQKGLFRFELLMAALNEYAEFTHGGFD